MISFKEAEYDYVKIFDTEGVYTEDLFTDKLPEGYHLYSVMFRDEQRILVENHNPEAAALIVTKEPVKITGKSKDIDETEFLFESKEFNFEEYFKGYHRPIDYKINEAENKKMEQVQSKDRSHSKAFSQVM